jgi:hypothetical protein
MLGVIGMGLCAARAQVQTTLWQFDDLGDNVNYILNGNTLFSEPETDPVGIGDGNVRLAADIDLGWNIYESVGGPLSDTLHIYGSRGQALMIKFISDVEGSTIAPLVSSSTATVSSIIETGDWQTVFNQALNGGTLLYTVQFRSDLETTVPDAGSSLTLMGMGLASLVAAGRRFRV